MRCWGCWYTCCSDFAVMRKGAVMAVSSPGLVEQALSETVDPQTLGGWKLHAETFMNVKKAERLAASQK